MLYITTGETFTSGLSQDLLSLGGKILRLDPEGGIPPITLSKGRLFTRTATETAGDQLAARDRQALRIRTRTVREFLRLRTMKSILS